MEKFIVKRKIKYLVHFTKLTNLSNILDKGLIPRETLNGLNVPEVTYSDNLRLDEHEYANCCSISFPNYKMFYKLRKTDDNIDW